MTKKSLLKSMLTLICLLLQFNLSAQISPVTIHVEEAGTLPTLIDENQKYEITDLKLTGDLNGTDIKFIREMAGRDSVGRVTDGKLSILNLEEAKIVSGGDSYYNDYYYTITNQISDYMFASSYLTNIILPNSVTSIEQCAFFNCLGLTNITIPEGVTSIGEIAFRSCRSLTSITIPNSVTTIGVSAFVFSGLTSITIPNGVIEIESGAFAYCAGLTDVSIGNSVTTIGDYAFQNCTGLTSITIPNSVTSIGVSAFENCTGLTSATIIGNGVTTIGNLAFSNCTNLANVTIGNGVTTIGGSVFSGCQGLTSVSIGNSVISIEDGAFSNCTRLTSVTVPNSVTSIGWSAFWYCRGLTNVTIGNSVTSIESNAFYSCTGLTEIYCKNPVPPSLGENCFAYVNKTTCKLYVPKGSKSAYQSAPEWKDFINIIEEGVSIDTIHEDNIIIQSVSNGIIIETKELTPVSVYTLSGQEVYQSVIIGNVEIALNKGAYIVKVNNASQKIIIK